MNKKTRASRQALTGSKQISFLPESDFNPKLPSKNTLAYRALLTVFVKGVVAQIFNELIQFFTNFLFF